MTHAAKLVIPCAKAGMIAALAIGMPAGTAAHGQDASEGLGDIVVTATRQESTMSKVPISLSVATAATLEKKSIRDVGDLARFTPGLTVDVSGTNNIAIRGVSSTGGSGTTGIYIDDVPIQMRNLGSAPDNALIKVFDLDRIEVLRGPQGTLFGSGSEGGTVRYITRPPSLTKFDGHAKMETSFTKGGAMSGEVGFAAGGPVIEDMLGVRVSAWYRRDGGWIDRIDPITLGLVEKNANRDDTVAVRASALWEPIPELKITPSIFYQNRDRNAPTLFWPTYSDTGSSQFVNADATSHEQPDRLFLPSLTVEGDLGFATLTSTTSYFSRKNISGGDGSSFAMSLFQQYAYYFASDPVYSQYFNVDTSILPLVDKDGFHIPADLATKFQDMSVARNRQRNFTQEVRLQSNDNGSPLKWTVGLFYSKNRQVNDFYEYEPDVDALFLRLFGAPFWATFGTPANADGTTYLADGTKSYTNVLTTREEQIALFGELEYKVTDALKLTLGLRASKSTVDLTNVSGGAQPNYGFSGSSRQSEKPVTPKASLSYQINPDHMVYATYAKGFRPGGGNAQIPFQSCEFDFQNFGISGAPLSYNSDTVDSFEIGAKNNFSNRVRIASSAYYIKWKNIQQNVKPPICAIDWTQNLGEAVSKGFDIQADILLTSALRLEVALGYTDARYTKDAFVGANTVGVLPVVADGDAITGAGGLPIAPWTVSLGAQYDFDVFSLPSFIRADYQYSSGEKWASALRDPNTAQYDPFAPILKAQNYVSMRAGTKGNGWSAAVFVENLLDSDTILSSSHTAPSYDSTTGAVLATPLVRAVTYRPRTIGLSLTLDY